MASLPFLTAGRIIQTAVGIITSTACYMADFNATHVYNPKWPPHAKFHNGQTMSFGLTLGLLTTFFVWKPKLFPSVLSSIDAKDASKIAAITGSLYYICGVSAILYPGTKWLDPEFKKSSDAPDEVGGQFYLFSALGALAWVGAWLTCRGIDGKSKVL